MNKKPTFAEKLQRFVEGKGFYIVVLICVAAIGVSGFYLLYSMDAGPGDDQPVNASAQVSLPPSPSPSVSAPAPSRSAAPEPTPPVISTPTPAPSPAPSASSAPAQSSRPSAAPSPAPASTPAPVPSKPVVLVYTWPVKGALLADFSLETLAYDVTMGDWRTHSGIDIAAALGSQVMATAAGTVSEIFADDLMGTTVVIDHGEGMTSTYANLQSVPTVEVGDKVYTGTVIGSVGATAIAESGRPGHLHFEMAKDGLAVDPELYLPEGQ